MVLCLRVIRRFTLAQFVKRHMSFRYLTSPPLLSFLVEGSPDDRDTLWLKKEVKLPGNRSHGWLCLRVFKEHGGQRWQCKGERIKATM